MRHSKQEVTHSLKWMKQNLREALGVTFARQWKGLAFKETFNTKWKSLKLHHVLCKEQDHLLFSLKASFVDLFSFWKMMITVSRTHNWWLPKLSDSQTDWICEKKEKDSFSRLWKPLKLRVDDPSCLSSRLNPSCFLPNILPNVSWRETKE